MRITFDCNQPSDFPKVIVREDLPPFGSMESDSGIFQSAVPSEGGRFIFIHANKKKKKRIIIKMKSNHNHLLLGSRRRRSCAEKKED